MKLKDITSSQLRHVIEIISHSDGVDLDGIPIKTENVVAKVRARVDVPSLKRQEALIGQGVNVTNTLQFVFRYIKDFDMDVHKVRYKGRVYNIFGLENVEERDLFYNVSGEYKK